MDTQQQGVKFSIQELRRLKKSALDEISSASGVHGLKMNHQIKKDYRGKVISLVSSFEKDHLGGEGRSTLFLGSHSGFVLPQENQEAFRSVLEGLDESFSELTGRVWQVVEDCQKRLQQQ